MVLGPRAVFVLGCWVRLPEFTDFVVFRPSSVASVNSRTAVHDSAIVQQPKDPPVCLSACLHHRVLSSIIICLLSRAAGLPNDACVYRHNQSSVTSRPSVPLPLTSTAYAHPSAASRPFHVAVHAAIASATALVPLDHGALLLFLAIVAAPSPIWRSALTAPPINRAPFSRPWYAQRQAARLVCGGLR